MRMLAFLVKSIRENIRDWKIFIITLVMAPIYVLITYSMYGNTQQSYTVIVNNMDRAVAAANGLTLNGGEALVRKIADAENSDSSKIFTVVFESNAQTGEKKLKDRAAELMITIPADFSKQLLQARNNGGATAPMLTVTGDETNPKYMMARVFVDVTAFEYIMDVTGKEMPVNIVEKTAGDVKALSMFDATVPGLLALSLVSLIFTACASIIKEVDRGTIKRIKISRISTTEFLTAISMTQAIISIPVLLLTFLTACLLGYRSSGSLLTVTIVGVLSSFSIMAISLLISSFIKSIFELMTVGSIPYFILLFFSGAFFPMPGRDLFAIAGHSIGATDFLPVSHTVSAMSKILNYHAGLADIAFELIAIAVLTVVYYSAGVLLFKKRHMS